jgi:hypothetical protein
MASASPGYSPFYVVQRHQLKDTARRSREVAVPVRLGGNKHRCGRWSSAADAGQGQSGKGETLRRLAASQHHPRGPHLLQLSGRLDLAVMLQVTMQLSPGLMTMRLPIPVHRGRATWTAQVTGIGRLRCVRASYLAIFALANGVSKHSATLRGVSGPLNGP